MLQLMRSVCEIEISTGPKALWIKCECSRWDTVHRCDMNDVRGDASCVHAGVRMMWADVASLANGLRKCKGLTQRGAE